MSKIVRSNEHASVSDDALALAMVMLARHILDQEREELAEDPSVVPVVSRRGRIRPGERPLCQTYYEDVEQLRATGMSNADAIRTVAKRMGKRENAVRGGMKQWKLRLEAAA